MLFDFSSFDRGVAIEEVGSPMLIEIDTNLGKSQSAFKFGMGVYPGRTIKEVHRFGIHIFRLNNIIIRHVR